ncbi:ATP-grasp domain-containing protein [Planctomycetota bacterium]
MPDNTRVLVVGTTPDYIDWIHQTWPGRALFLTDIALRQTATEPDPDPSSEVLVDLKHPAQSSRRLTEHLRHYGLHLGGITCFDCEAMPLTARLAELFQLPYPSLAAVESCRNKYRCQQAWRKAGIPCPETHLMTEAKEAVAFFERTDGACVLKPLQGAGSEFVYRCHHAEEVLQAAREIHQGLERQKENRLYQGTRHQFLAEAYVEGPEYSCDFLLEENRLLVIRLARKLPRPGAPFGTVQAYLVPADLPENLSQTQLENLLTRSAQALGLSGIICMVDFIMGPNGPVLLEMAPRPGGDCLPSLIRHAAGVDILGITLDRAEGYDVTLPPPSQWRPCVGLRLFAPQEGKLLDIDIRQAQADPRVLEIELKQGPGHQIVFPPRDYDGWLLGHLFFTPDPDQPIESQCEELLKTVQMTIEETP